MRRGRFQKRRPNRQFRFKTRTNWRANNTNRKRLFKTSTHEPTVDVVTTLDLAMRPSQFATFAVVAAPYKKFRVRNALVEIKFANGWKDSTFGFNADQSFMVSWKDPLDQDTGVTTLDVAMNKMSGKKHPLTGFRRKVVPVTQSTDDIGTIAATVTNQSKWYPVSADIMLYEVLNITFPAMNAGGADPVPYDINIWVDFEFSGRAN